MAKPNKTQEKEDAEPTTPRIRSGPREVQYVGHNSSGIVLGNNVGLEREYRFNCPGVKLEATAKDAELLLKRHSDIFQEVT